MSCFLTSSLDFLLRPKESVSLIAALGITIALAKSRGKGGLPTLCIEVRGVAKGGHTEGYGALATLLGIERCY